MNLPLVVLAVSLVTSPGLAQSRPEVDLINRWATDKQVYVTKQAREKTQAQAARTAGERTLKVEGVGVRASQTTAEAQEQAARTLNGWLENFPTIRLIVQPAPPRDYSVAINGEDCPPTERGLYKVPSGLVQVRVERAGKPPCVWSGRLTDGRTQEVPCNF
jgi:hypothetical protein